MEWGAGGGGALLHMYSGTRAVLSIFAFVTKQRGYIKAGQSSTTRHIDHNNVITTASNASLSLPMGDDSPQPYSACRETEYRTVQQTGRKVYTCPDYKDPKHEHVWWNTRKRQSLQHERQQQRRTTNIVQGGGGGYLTFTVAAEGLNASQPNQSSQKPLAVISAA